MSPSTKTVLKFPSPEPVTPLKFPSSTSFLTIKPPYNGLLAARDT